MGVAGSTPARFTMAKIEDSIQIRNDDNVYTLTLKTEATLPDTAAEIIKEAKQAIKAEMND